ncbi:MAG TPA: hypothetical protein VNY05_22580 [Candidatus Acidoferrales bacterium]|jgi:hypothetical protein|nr:hypothetical protein [Candidatus Acidoferrales bacterium]
MTNPIIIVEMRTREQSIIAQLSSRVFELQAQQQQNGGILDPSLQAELAADIAKLNSAGQPPPGQVPVPTPPANPVALDPLYQAVASAFAQTNQPIAPDQVDGKLPSQQDARLANQSGPNTLSPQETAFAAAYGILIRDGNTNPDVGARFSQALSSARGEYNASPTLFENVLHNLIRQGRVAVTAVNQNSAASTALHEFQVSAGQWAAVVQSLVRQGVPATDFHLEVKTLFALAGQEGVNDNAPPSSISIDLPDLDAQTNVDIITDNLVAMQGLHFAAMFEEVKAFAVVDKLVEQFTLGQLPLGRGNAGDTLYGYWKKSINRLTEIERRNLYSRAFGTPGGDPTAGSPNTDYADLMIRFVSTVSAFSRQLTIDDLFRNRTPAPVNQEQLKKSGRDLAGNLSLHGYGMAYFAAIEMQTQIKEIIGLLSDDEIKTAYGAKDMWGVIDQVASLELGGAKNSIKYRTMATAGATIIKWLSDHAADLTTASRFSILDTQSIRNPPLKPVGQKPTVNPTDRDLVDACDAWLAVTGTQDTRVEEYSQPTEGPMQTSAPIRIPALARDMLEQAGVKPLAYVQPIRRAQGA